MSYGSELKNCSFGSFVRWLEQCEKHKDSKEVLQEVLDERIQQQEEYEWSSSHDDGHTEKELVRAAVSYALAKTDWNEIPIYSAPYGEPESSELLNFINIGRMIWPEYWGKLESKISDKSERKRLIVAIALLVAEVERLDRKNAST